MILHTASQTPSLVLFCWPTQAQLLDSGPLGLLDSGATLLILPGVSHEAFLKSLQGSSRLSRKCLHIFPVEGLHFICDHIFSDLTVVTK